ADLADDYNLRIQAYLGAAVEELQRQGYERIVLAGIGRGAFPVTRQTLDGPAGSALVWIAPAFPLANLQTLAAELGARDSLRILDVVSSRQGGKAARERAALMKRNGLDNAYSQQSVAMPEQPLGRNAGQVVNRLLAWLGR
ncbi:MAG: DUF3530 family protein, partial [Alphaproteobacteria bacterium]|nr:DUF3530 family protein [Alphaproteobacteria bacterium]